MLPIAICCCSVTAPPATDLVDAYNAWSLAFDGAEYHFHIRENYHGPKPVNGTMLREGDYLVRRDGQRWRIEYEGIARLPVDRQGKVETSSHAFEFSVANPPTFVQVGRDGDAKEVQFVLAHLNGLPAERPITVATDDFMAVYGYINGNGTRSIQDILKESALSTATDIIDGTPVWRLDANGVDGKLQIWFDTERSRRVHRLLLTKTGSDRFGKKRLNEIPAADPSDLYYPAARLQKVSVLLDMARFGQLGDDRVPADMTLVTTMTYSNDSRVEMRYEMHIDEFSRNPVWAADAFDVSAPIPEGFVVQVEDQPNVDYEWRNGKISKKVNRGTLANLMASVFETAFSGVGYFVVFAGLLLGIAAAGAWAYRRHRT